MINLTMVRHTSVDVPPMTCYGQTDVPLKASFEEEAAEVKRRLEGRRFDGVYVSPLSRCVKLAEYCGYGDAIRDKRLLELDFGEWEMKGYDDIHDPRLQEWYEDYINVRATGGESFADQRARLLSFLDEKAAEYADGSHLLIFAHGGILLQAMIINGIVEEKSSFTAVPPYGGIIEVRYPAD